METNKGKIVVVDWGCIMFTAIFAHKFTPQIPVTYTTFNMVLANLLKVGVNAEDTVIIACDKGKSWRKQYDSNYKADRKEKREKTDIDWNYMFEQMNNLLIELDISTNWHIIQIDNMEADDIQAVATKYYNDKEVVLITFDADMEMLLSRPNVKIFSPKSKKYKFNKNPLKLLAKKIVKESADNLNNPVTNESEYNTRNLIVNLLELPEFVENAVVNQLKNLEPKMVDNDIFPFLSLKEKYLNLYNDKSKLVTLEDSEPKKKTKKKVKKCLVKSSE